MVSMPPFFCTWHAQQAMGLGNVRNYDVSGTEQN